MSEPPEATRRQPGWDYTRMANGIGEPVDRKFHFDAFSRSGSVYNEDHAVVFLAKDLALRDTLEFYLQRCSSLGVAEDQLSGIRLLIERVVRYQVANPDLLKVPDVRRPQEDAVVAPNRDPGEAGGGDVDPGWQR